MVLVSKIEGDNTENTQWINNRVIKYARVYLVMMDDEDIRIKGAVNATDIMLDAKRKRMNNAEKLEKIKGKGKGCPGFLSEIPY